MNNDNPFTVKKESLLQKTCVYEGIFDLVLTNAPLLFQKIIDSDLFNIISPLFEEAALIKPGLTVYNNIHETRLMHRICLFIEQTEKGIKCDKWEDFKEKYHSESKFHTEVVSFIIQRLDSMDDDYKSVILGSLFSSYINGDINLDKFSRLSYSVIRTHPSVFKYLFDFFKINEYKIKSNCNSVTGIFPANEAALISGSGLGTISNENITIWKDALDLCEFGLKQLFNDKYTHCSERVTYFMNRAAYSDALKLDKSFSDYEKNLVNQQIAIEYAIIQKSLCEKFFKFYEKYSNELDHDLAEWMHIGEKTP